VTTQPLSLVTSDVAAVTTDPSAIGILVVAGGGGTSGEGDNRGSGGGGAVAIANADPSGSALGPGGQSDCSCSARGGGRRSPAVTREASVGSSKPQIAEARTTRS
jgi:hypothetical protein